MFLLRRLTTRFTFVFNKRGEACCLSPSNQVAEVVSPVAGGVSAVGGVSDDGGVGGVGDVGAAGAAGAEGADGVTATTADVSGG